MKQLIFACSVIAGMAAHISAQQMQNNAERSLFSDHKASHEGDQVTVLIVEDNNASNSATTTSTRQSTIGVAASGNVGKAAATGGTGQIGTNSDFKGDGGTSSQNTLRAKLSARVKSVQDNGDLIIEGSRKITINGEDQVIKLVGIIRTVDVQPDNSVYSYNIADAEITFEGSGIVSRAQGPGWVTKLLHWIF